MGSEMCIRDRLITDQNVVFSDPSLKPIYQRALPEYSELIFKDVDASVLTEYGKVVIPSLEDLFVAINV